jgi:hypothetical protein
LTQTPPSSQHGGLSYACLPPVGMAAAGKRFCGFKSLVFCVGKQAAKNPVNNYFAEKQGFFISDLFVSFRIF